MRLTDDQIKMARITYTKVVQDDFILDLIDTIEAQQQEIDRLKATLDDWKYQAKCDADHIAALTADKDEQAGRLMRYDAVLKQAKEALQEAWGDDGSIAVGNRILETIKAIDALLGGKDDEKE